MKLAEALQIRADLQMRLSGMRERLANNAKVQEGTEPAEKPSELLAELDDIAERLCALVERINISNATITDREGRTLTSLIAERDMHRSKADLLRGFLNEASAVVNRRASAEIRVFPAVDIAALRRECDEVSKRLRLTEARIQEMNWTHELME